MLEEVRSTDNTNNKTNRNMFGRNDTNIANNTNKKKRLDRTNTNSTSNTNCLIIQVIQRVPKTLAEHK